MPKRIHMKNFLQSLSPNGKRVIRPSRWGNSFTTGSRKNAVKEFAISLNEKLDLVKQARKELSGYDLECTCPLDKICHADIWLQWINCEDCVHMGNCRSTENVFPCSDFLEVNQDED